MGSNLAAGIRLAFRPWTADDDRLGSCCSQDDSRLVLAQVYS